MRVIAAEENVNFLWEFQGFALRAGANNFDGIYKFFNVQSQFEFAWYLFA